MTVYVYSTGSVLKTSNTEAEIRASINNRTTEDQIYRIIVWNTSSGTKTALFDFTDPIPPNNTNHPIFFIPGYLNVSSYEVEFRFINPHIAPYIQQRYADLFNSSIFEPVYADEMFRDSTSGNQL
ncbi:hypothetical protein [Paenibacillus koleovorans]|uniref:hypothetical protein n=1 Tax=Paenibacillus koleovorans TaxID=121608 RepID=UPI000FD7DB2E|nr:hypothetical protein [Paenibacillus koleovorans]